MDLSRGWNGKKAKQEESEMKAVKLHELDDSCHSLICI